MNPRRRPPRHPPKGRHQVWASTVGAGTSLLVAAALGGRGWLLVVVAPIGALGGLAGSTARGAGGAAPPSATGQVVGIAVLFGLVFVVGLAAVTAFL